MNCSCNKKCSVKGLALLIGAALLITAMIVLSGCSLYDAGSKASVVHGESTVNSVCPMKGLSFDPARVPETKVRHFQGKKVGFCCKGCPAKWDALSDAQKAMKLKSAM